MSDWSVELNGIRIGGCDDPLALGTLGFPPDGLGLPDIRTEDVTYPQRDGVRHFADWYEPRIITLEEVTVCPDDDCTGDCTTAREKVQQILKAWSRQCEDVELVIRTNCDPGCDGESPGGSPGGVNRAVVGPFGIRGRPRVAKVTWLRSNSGCAELLLRFDAVDHRMFVLDCTGEPGSGVVEVTLQPSNETQVACFPFCFTPTVCFNTDISESDTGPEVVEVIGTECSYPVICFYGQLTNPRLENLTTGEVIGIRGTVGVTEPPICIDTETGTAEQGGAPRTHLITGNSRFALQPGENEIRLVSFSAADDGYATVEFRNNVVSA